MDDSRRRHGHAHRDLHLSRRRRSWCCSFAVPPSSPDTKPQQQQQQQNKSDSKPSINSVPSSPQSSKSGLSLPGRIHPRRILSPGRVSPIIPIEPATVGPKTPSFRAANVAASGSGRDMDNGVFDVRLNLRGKSGNGLVLELSSEVLCVNSEVFRGLIDGSRKSDAGSGLRMGVRVCTVEVGEVENLGVFRETIELMFEDERSIVRRLMRIGAYHAINVLEVSTSIMFTRGVSSCLKYLEGVPWTEEEEEKLRCLLTKFKLDNDLTRDILARLYAVDSVDSQENLVRQLISSITTCVDANSRNELKSLVKGLLSKSSVYEKGPLDIKKEDLYAICQSCMNSIVSLFEEASDSIPPGTLEKENKTLIERISQQVDNIIWLLEIFIDRQVAEEFVEVWANQDELCKLHHVASPMIRYELSRISANLFIAIGNRKVHCYSEARSALLQEWFGPMLLDFGWLQRCRKGLDMRALEEALGQTLLTLPLKQQHVLFMEWFRCFSRHGTECPNLSKAFQIWWRRTSSRGSETCAVESR